MDLSWVTVIVTAVLSTGAGSVLTVILTGRASASKIEAEATSVSAKIPAEVDSVAIQGAEGAVLMMQGVNDRLLSEIARKDDYIGKLEQMVATLRDQLNEANALGAELLRKLRDADAQYGDLQREIERHRSETTRISAPTEGSGQ